MLAGRQVLLERVVVRLAVLPHIVFLHELAIIEPDVKRALARVEDECSVDGQVEHQLVVARRVDSQRACNGGLLVEREPFAVRARLRTAEFRPAKAALGHELGDGRHGRGHDCLGRLHVLFQEERRHRKHVADGVEAVAGVIGGKLFVGFEVESRQVADRVAVLDAVQAANRDAAGVDILGIDAERFALDPVGQNLQLVVG